MQHNIISTVISFVIASAAIQSCSDEPCSICPDSLDSRKSELTLSVKAAVRTKVGEYLEEQSYEEQINDIQIFIFDSNGRLNAYKHSAQDAPVSITTTYGQKKVWAVVNGPDYSAVRSVSELTAKAIDLNANSVIASEGFVMTGTINVNIDRSDVSKELLVQRLVSRVALCSITNNLPAAYSDMSIESITLANVVGNQNVSGTAAVEKWYNQMGRQDGTSDPLHIIDGVDYMATYPELTFAKPEATEKVIANGSSLNTKYFFYSYPNPTTTDVTGWSTQFSARKTRLIIRAKINGEIYHYPVVLKNVLERNKAYTVNVTITALGSTDPDKPVEKGTLTTTIKVDDWGVGAIYNETI